MIFMLGYFFSLGTEDITAITTHVSNLFSDLSLVIILIVGVAIGIWVITAIISTIRK